MGIHSIQLKVFIFQLHIEFGHIFDLNDQLIFLNLCY